MGVQCISGVVDILGDTLFFSVGAEGIIQIIMSSYLSSMTVMSPLTQAAEQ